MSTTNIVILAIGAISVVALVGSIVAPSQSSALVPVATMGLGGIVGFLSQPKGDK